MRKPALLLFVDIKSAFYALVREVVVGAIRAESDEPLLRLFHRIGVPPAALQELGLQLQRLCVLAEAEGSSHLHQLTADLFQGTWFRLELLEPITATARGSRPGDPAASVVFSLGFAAYLRAATAALNTADLLPRLPTLQGVPLIRENTGELQVPFLSWADDLLHTRLHGCPQQLLTDAISASELLLRHSAAFGLEWGAGVTKTAFMLHLPGTYRVEAHPAYVLSDGPCLRVAHSVYGALDLPIVQAYKHLGSILTADNSMMPEIGYRASLAYGALQPLRRPFFTSAAFPLHTRATLLRANVLSRFVTGCGAIPLLKGPAFRRWCQVYVSLWRALWKREGREGLLPHAFVTMAHVHDCSWRLHGLHCFVVLFSTGLRWLGTG